MTSLRALLRKLLGQDREADGQVSSSEYSYAIYWTELARDWSPDKRLRVRSLVQAVISRPDFVPNTFDRRYCVEDTDGLDHAGVSLLALEKVLTSFIEQSNREE